MDFETFSDMVLQMGSQIFDHMEVYHTRKKSLQIGVFEGQVDKYSISNASGTSLRAMARGAMGYSYTEKMDEESARKIVEQAFENSLFNDSEDSGAIPETSKQNQVYDSFKRSEDIPTEEKIKLMLDLEKKATSMDRRVKGVQNCLFEDFEEERFIRNTKGLNKKDSKHIGLVYLSVLAKDGNETKTGKRFLTFREFTEINIDRIATEAVMEAITLMGGNPIKSGKYRAVIKNKVFADILEGFSPVFSAENIQKGLSIFKGKLGERIGSKSIYIVEDPLMELGLGSCTFDDEGFPTSKKNIVSEGVLRNYLFNSKTAAYESRQSSGNGFRNSYKSPIGTRPTNFYLMPGEEDFDKLLESVEDGVCITEVTGLHSGLSAISGDFSLQAQGFVVRNGKMEEPVNGVTISGNLVDLLGNMESVGSDLMFGLPGGGHYGSPSVLVSEINVSGK